MFGIAQTKAQATAIKRLAITSLKTGIGDGLAPSMGVLLPGELPGAIRA
jgi:hypothetical protein